ncbi:hypothetical protein FRC02_005683 [Tulasnella sp. 418]|nr:hypothetical protein FRC02_005683 [Tulasnella sp. 418]
MDQHSTPDGARPDGIFQTPPPPYGSRKLFNHSQSSLQGTTNVNSPMRYQRRLTGESDEAVPNVQGGSFYQPSRLLSSLVDLYGSSEPSIRRMPQSQRHPDQDAEYHFSTKAPLANIAPDGDVLDHTSPSVLKETTGSKNHFAIYNTCSSTDDIEEKEERRSEIIRTTEDQIRAMRHSQGFILKLSRALMLYGAPSHRLESQLTATAKVLQVNCQIVHFPGIVVLSFDGKGKVPSETHVVKATTRLMLGKLHSVHTIYRAVMHGEIGVSEGTSRLKKLMVSGPAYSTGIRCFIAFCSASIISPLAFGGSILDASISGCAGAILAYLQLHAVKRSMMYANVFEITTAMWVAFVARALSSWKGDYFCYSAISTAGVVLILPGFAMLCSALDLASKNLISGSARLVWAISYTLFLGFSMTVGSDLYYVIDSTARERRRLAVESLTNTLVLNGFIVPDNSTTFEMVENFRGQWTFVNQTRRVSSQYHYQVVGCYRDQEWPWYRKPFPVWSLFILVPLYSTTSSLWNLQPLRSWELLVMVAISCTSYASRKILQHFIGDRKEVVSATGAFVIGILGNAYARVYKATPFTSMVTGVLFLVPSGIAAAGGLARNYNGTDADQYTSSITIGIRMLQVAIGTTVGLLTSSLVVYTFGSKKRSGLFAF